MPVVDYIKNYIKKKTQVGKPYETDEGFIKSGQVKMIDDVEKAEAEAEKRRKGKAQ